MMYRRYSPYGMWNEMDRFQREMNRTFDRALSSRYPTIPEFPALNVWRDEAGAVVTAELPGLKVGRYRNLRYRRYIDLKRRLCSTRER